MTMKIRIKKTSRKRDPTVWKVEKKQLSKALHYYIQKARWEQHFQITINEYWNFILLKVVFTGHWGSQNKHCCKQKVPRSAPGTSSRAAGDHGERWCVRVNQCFSTRFSRPDHPTPPDPPPAFGYWLPWVLHCLFRGLEKPTRMGFPSPQILTANYCSALCEICSYYRKGNFNFCHRHVSFRTPSEK